MAMMPQAMMQTAAPAGAEGEATEVTVATEAVVEDAVAVAVAQQPY